VQLTLGGSWRFYRAFWQAHGLGEMPAMDLHDVGPIKSGGEVRVPLLLINPTAIDQTVTVTAKLPPGWKEAPRSAAVVVPANGEVQFMSGLVGQEPATGTIATVTYELGGGGAGNTPPLTIQVYFHPHGNALPQ
jgi:hypothetical protein